MKTKIPSQQETSEKLRRLARGSKREEMIEQGAYDGRYRKRSVQSQIHKNPKYKHKIYEY